MLQTVTRGWICQKLPDGKACYPRYSSGCGWNALLPARLARPPVSGRVDCDVVIIGAGYTGVAAARRFAAIEPDASIVLLDASVAGEGNPGRNSGFLLEISLANDADPAALQRMRACNDLVAAAMQKIETLVSGNGIDCALERSGVYRAAAGAGGQAAIENYRQFLEGAGLPYETLSRDELEARIGTRFYRSGLFSPHCYLAQPAALIRGLVDCLPRSVLLHENTPAVSLARRDGRMRVTTPAGSVSADRVVIANNAFAKALGIGRSRVAAIYTYAALTEPLQARHLDDMGGVTSWGLLPAHRLGSTMRRTPDGRLLVRSCYDYERERDIASVAQSLKDCLTRRFPALGDVAFAHTWGGATGFTLNGGPLWGEIERGVFVSAGCNGGGVVKGTLFGELLADLACGRDVPDVDALFGRAAWMPPEPLRRAGFAVTSALERRRGHAEI